MNKIYWHIKNLIPRITFHAPVLNEDSRETLHEMKTMGFSVKRLDELTLKNLQKEAEEIMAADPKYLEYINEMKPVGEGKAKEWTYTFKTPKEGPMMDLAQSQYLQEIADSYLGMKAVMTEAHLSVSIPGDKPRGSSFWHRDRGDYQYFRAFIYLDDISEEIGGGSWVCTGKPIQREICTHLSQ